MKNYLIRRRASTKEEDGFVYLKSITSTPESVQIETLPLIRIGEGVKSFETYHEAVSVMSKHLSDNMWIRWFVVSAHDVLVEAVKELAEARA